MIHVRGNNLPGLNFVPEADTATTSNHHRHLRNQQSTVTDLTINHVDKATRGLEGGSNMDQRVITHDPSPKGSDGYFIPPHWQTCNDEINEGFSSDQKTQSVTALQYISRHIRVLLYSGGNI